MSPFLFFLFVLFCLNAPLIDKRWRVGGLSLTGSPSSIEDNATISCFGILVNIMIRTGFFKIWQGHSEGNTFLLPDLPVLWPIYEFKMPWKL